MFTRATNGAQVGYDLHSGVSIDPSAKAHIYQCGSSKGDKGSIEAVFDGVHGCRGATLESSRSRSR